MSSVGASVGSRHFFIWQILTIAERTLSGLAHPPRVEEMDRELTKIIEDFDRAINVEALRLAKGTSKYSFIAI